MARVYFVLLCAALFVACNNAYSVEKGTGLSVKVVEDIAKFRSEFPSVKLVPLQRAGTSQAARFTLGKRNPSDTNIAGVSGLRKCPSPQDVQLQFGYPLQEGLNIECILTYIEIDVAQSDAGVVGNAYVVSGGIGQKSIDIVVEAMHTTTVAFKATFYGK